MRPDITSPCNQPPAELRESLGVELSAFHRGEPEALAEAVESSFDPVWFLARQGFTCVENGITIYVRAADDLDVAEADTRVALAAALTPSARQEVTDLEDWTIHLLTHARRVLLERAVRAGRTTSLLNPEEAEQVPSEAENLDRLIEADVRPARREPTISPELEELLRVGQTEADALKKGLGHDLARLVEERFVNGLTRQACARVFDCGPATIATRESRIRRRLLARLKSHGDAALARAKEATLDALISGRGGGLVPPAITRERIRQTVLTRTFRTDARPYGQRLAWGLATAAVASIGWMAMFFGWLPGPDDDRRPVPRVRVTCPQGCLPGRPVTVALQAPEFGRTVGVGLVDHRGVVSMLLDGPYGGSVRLPFGARAKLVEAGQTLIPDRQFDLSRATVVAVFADRQLDPHTLETAVALDALPDRIATATAALVGSVP